MEQRKRPNRTRVVGYFCQGFALLLLVGAILLLSRGRLEAGLGLLVTGLGLLTVGMVTAGRRKSTPPS